MKTKQGLLMTLSITGSPVLIGNDDIGHIEFLPTNMDAVDGSGRPTDERLFIARTLHTRRARDLINAHLADTHGSIVMHKDGTAYVVGRGTERDPQRVRRTPVMDVGHNTRTVISVRLGIRFVPDSTLIMADPNFATHPAVKMTWYESASQAAAIEDAHRAATGQDVHVRMMRDLEYTRFVTWDGKYTEAEVIARAHLCGDDFTGTASVADANAASRTTDEGFVDAFGNVSIWTDNAKARPRTLARKQGFWEGVGSVCVWQSRPTKHIGIDRVARIERGAAWQDGSQFARVDYRNTVLPFCGSNSVGVRWVAVLRP